LLDSARVYEKPANPVQKSTHGLAIAVEDRPDLTNGALAEHAADEVVRFPARFHWSQHVRH